MSGCQRHTLIEKVPVEIIGISVFMGFYPAPVRSQGNALHEWVCKCGIVGPIMYRVSHGIAFSRYIIPMHRGRLRARRGRRRKAESPRRLQRESQQVVAKREAKYERRLSRKKRIPG